MDRFEQELRSALRREQPSGEFTTRVLAKVTRPAAREIWSRPWLNFPRMRWAVAMVLCVVVLAGLGYRHEQARRRAEGEAARRQVMLALRIANAKIKLAQMKVQQLSER
jgi:hypothetical protein